MNKPNLLLKTCSALTAAILIVITGSSCSTPQPDSSNTPGQSVVVTQDVTQEVTRIVEVPVTVTPGPTLASTATPDPSLTNSAALPQASLPEYTDCLYGPATYYVYKTSFPAGQQVDVVGRNENADWINIEEVGGWNSCWILASQAQIQSGRVEDLPVVNTMLPKSEYEFGSPSAAARREGDQVTVSWEAVYMSADEVHGYLIDAYVCEGGQYIHLPVFVGVTYEQNTGTITADITDEAGCTESSTAHIVSVGKRGFAEWEKIFWPAQ